VYKYPMWEGRGFEIRVKDLLTHQGGRGRKGGKNEFRFFGNKEEG